MTVTVLLLSIAALATIGLGVFFWKIIKSERKAGNACMACHQQLIPSSKYACPQCGFVVCGACREKRASCPHCQAVWPHLAPESAKITG